MTAADTQRFLSLIVPGRRFVLTTHVNPDGDGLGSQLGLAWLLRAMGAVPQIINHDPTPARLRFLDPDDTIQTYDPAVHDVSIESADLVVMLDNGDPDRLDRMRAPLDRCRGQKVCIDHHPDPPAYWDFMLHRVGASSTGEIIAELIQATRRTPDVAAARALYTAVSSDTGRFRFGNTTQLAFQTAAWLVHCGAKPAELYDRLEQGLSHSYCRLLGQALANMEIAADGALVLLRVPLSWPDARAVDGEDLARIINEALRVDGCRVAALFRELESGQTKISLRSNGGLDVRSIAKSQGGGGHRSAAGAVVSDSMESTIERMKPVLTALARS